MARVLVVDDEEHIRRRYSQELSDEPGGSDFSCPEGRRYDLNLIFAGHPVALTALALGAKSSMGSIEKRTEWSKIIHRKRHSKGGKSNENRILHHPLRCGLALLVPPCLCRVKGP